MKMGFVRCNYLTNGQISVIAAEARKEANQEVSPVTKSEIFSKSFQQHQSVLDPSHKCFNLSWFSREGGNSSSSSGDQACEASLNDHTL